MAEVLTPQEVYKKAQNATVHVTRFDAKGQIAGTGSGFFVRPNQIATNYHVIEGAATANLGAKLVNQTTGFTIESISAVDKLRDLAILQVSARGVKPLPLGDSEAIEVGDTVYAVGNPVGLEGTFSHGMISQIRERVEWGSGKRFQYTASGSPGSSGGPIVNKRGEVIGVVQSGYHYLQNLNFAIPSNYLASLLDRHLASEQAVPPKVNPKKPKSSKSVEPKPNTPKADPKKTKSSKIVWARVATVAIIAIVIALVTIFVTRSNSLVSVSINAVPWAEVYIKPPGTISFIKPRPQDYNIKPGPDEINAHVTPIRGGLRVPSGTQIKLVHGDFEQIFPYKRWKGQEQISHEFSNP